MATIPDYPSSKNSVVPTDNARPEAPEREKEPDSVKVVHKAEIKKSKWQEFASAFFEEDISSVRDYIYKEVLIKGIKDLIFEGIRVFFYPSGGGRSARRGFGGYYSYDKRYDEGVPFRPAGSSNTRNTYMPKSAVDFASVTFDRREYAQDVLDEMVDYIQHYGQISVARFYDFAGVTPPHTANKFGWYKLDGAETVTLPGGKFGLYLPKPVPLS